MIVKMDKVGITQKCANCGAQNEIGYDSLQAGLSFHGSVHSKVIALPVCGCGAIETLLAHPDAHPRPESHAGRHRAGVNRLFMVLEGKSKVIEGYEALGEVEDLLEDPLKGEVVIAPE